MKAQAVKDYLKPLMIFESYFKLHTGISRLWWHKITYAPSRNLNSGA